jgi:hypothetical protein
MKWNPSLTYLYELSTYLDLIRLPLGERPDEPVTTGINPGSGAGSDSLMMNQPDDYTNFNSNIKSYTPVLSYVASLENTSPETRRAIRQIMDSL